MKKLLFYKIIPIGLLLSLLSFIVVYIWLTKYSWTEISSESEMELNSLEIMKTPDFSKNFYTIYDILYPKDRKESMTEQLKGKILFPFHRRVDCKCDDIGYISWNNKNLSLKLELSEILKQNGYWKFGFGINSKVSPEKCFDYWINNNISLNGKYLSDLNELALLKIGKSIKSMNTEEIIKLIAWYKMLDYGIRDEKKVEKKVEVYKRMLKKANT